MHSHAPDGMPSTETADDGPGQAPWIPSLPPLASGYISRPETGQALEAALQPGSTTVLVTDLAAAGRRTWRDTCGKTQLAAAAARSLWQRGLVEQVIWVSAGSRASVLSCYAEAARARDRISAIASGDAEAAAVRFVGWLRESTRPWLVVLDGLTADAALDDRLWPAGPAGRLLITTTDPAALTGHQARPVPVGPFSPREALNYLIGRLTMDVDQRQGAVDLTAELGGEPLALAQAAAVIASSELTCHEYLEHFLHRRSQTASAVSGGIAPAAITWGMSIDQSDMVTPGISQSVLLFAALLDGTAIPGSVFTTAAARAYCGQPSAGGRGGTVRDGLAVLERAGLLSAEPGPVPVIRMSWPVQAAVLATMPDGMLKGASAAAADALLEAWPAADTDEALARALRSCTAALRAGAGSLLWEGSCHPLLLRAGTSLDSAPLPGPAVAYWEELARISARQLGQDHPSTSQVSERLAHAYLAAGRASDAISLLQAIRQGRLARLGPSHPGTLEATRGLGQALTRTGRFGEAVTILTDAADGLERSYGAGSPAALSAREDLAAALRAAGQFPDAIKLYRAVLTERERTQGAQSAETIVTRQKLAEAYLVDGQAKQAISQYERVASDREKVLGRDHLLTIAAHGALGSAYHAAGRMASAVRFGERTRTEYAKVLGTDHPDTLSACVNLAHAYYGVGRLTDAARLLQDTLERCEQSLPPNHPLTASARDSLANISGS